ncbi:MAG: Fur family transcriptional regulator [Armatimonadota bacterium]
MPELQSLLHRTGRRMTSQRAAVYQALSATTSHPTAEELFLIIRGQMPHISLATVYNNLEMLVESGLAIKLSGDRSARYDPVCTPHAHARCTGCGEVIDLPPHDVQSMLDVLTLPDGFHPSATAIDVEGLCADCKRRVN